MLPEIRRRVRAEPRRRVGDERVDQAGRRTCRSSRSRSARASCRPGAACGGCRSRCRDTSRRPGCRHRARGPGRGRRGRIAGRTPFTKSVKRCVSVGAIVSDCACVSRPALTASASSCFSCVDERRDQARLRLAARRVGDLGERLARLELREQRIASSSRDTTAAASRSSPGPWWASPRAAEAARFDCEWPFAASAVPPSASAAIPTRTSIELCLFHGRSFDRPVKNDL